MDNTSIGHPMVAGTGSKWGVTHPARSNGSERGSACRSRSLFSCPHRLQVGAGGQRGALGADHSKTRSGCEEANAGEVVDNLRLSVDS